MTSTYAAGRRIVDIDAHLEDNPIYLLRARTVTEANLRFHSIG